MLEYYRENKKVIHVIFYVCIFLILTTLFFKYILSYVFPFILAYFFSVTLYPVKNFFWRNLKLASGISAFLSCVLFVFLIGLFSKTILSRIFLEGKFFVSNLPVYIKNFSCQIEIAKQRYKHFMNIIPDRFKDNISVYCNQILNLCANKILKSGSGNVVKFIPAMFINVIVSLMATFFLLKDKELVDKFFNDYLPNKILVLFRCVKEGCLCGLMAYVKSELILMCVTGVVCTLGYSIIRYPYALFLGMVTALVDALPILGTGFIIWPWVAYCFLTGTYSKGIILIATYIISIASRQLLSPKLIGKQIGVHPLAMLIAIYIGLKLFGFLGMIIGPIIIIVGKIVFEEVFQGQNFFE